MAAFGAEVLHPVLQAASVRLRTLRCLESAGFWPWNGQALSVSFTYLVILQPEASQRLRSKEVGEKLRAAGGSVAAAEAGRFVSCADRLHVALPSFARPAWIS